LENHFHAGHIFLDLTLRNINHQSNRELLEMIDISQSQIKKDMTSVKMIFQLNSIHKPIFVVRQPYFMQRSIIILRWWNCYCRMALTH
jgi:hypothetical protein